MRADPIKNPINRYLLRKGWGLSLFYSQVSSFAFLVSIFSPLLLSHKRIFRLTLTRTPVKHSIILKFSRFRRNSRFVLHGQLL
jgi:hypothetical protein